MGKKPQRHAWPEAKKRCRLSHYDVVMAKRLGFEPEALIQSIPNPKQKQDWKPPVKDWVRELYRDRYGDILGETPAPPAAVAVVSDEEATRRFEEQIYWEDYYERNEDSGGVARR